MPLKQHIKEKNVAIPCISSGNKRVEKCIVLLDIKIKIMLFVENKGLKDTQHISTTDTPLNSLMVESRL